MGLVMLAGPGIQVGHIEGTHLWDLAPTILHLCGVGIPTDMDGRVLTQAFEAIGQFTYQESLTVDNAGGIDDEHDETVRARLEGLGYL
jgi:hypothetical protein